MSIRRAGAFALPLLLIVATPAPADDLAPVDREAFAKLFPEGAKVEKLGGGMKFTEGPVWVPAERGGMLLFSDIPADEIKRWTAAEGLAVFRTPSRGANGNTTDRQGRLITCEHRSRSVVRNDVDGSLRTLADAYNGRKLNSPNDAAVRSDGSIWFTDPPYGLEGRDKEQRGNYVFRLDPETKDLKAMIVEIAWPNGICFSPDESLLYVANSDVGNAVIYATPFKKDGTLGTPLARFKIDKGQPDGIRCDADGRVWSSAGDGVHVFAADGTLLGKVLVPETPANLCFGGDDGRTLFITAKTSLYSIKTSVTGAKPAAAKAP
jgi:gluconolactonase